MSEQPRAAVIGSGFGGLALAIRLQANGYQTTLLEKRDKPGGRAYVYEDQGFTFDGGPTVITDPTALEELFTQAGRQMRDYVELLPVDPMYRLCWENGDVFDYTNDQERLERQIREMNPDDVAGYREFLQFSRDVFAEGYLKLGSVPFLDFRSMLRVAPQLVRLKAYRSVYSIVSRYIRNEHLRQAFSFHPLLVGGNPFKTSSIYALIHALEREWGVWFPRGGTGALIQALVRLFEDLGGEFRLNAEVDEILVTDGRVKGLRTADGWSAEFDAVASNADVMHTYRHMLRGSERGPKEARRLARMRYSMSLFVIYFGLNRTYPDLQHHMVLFGPRYRGLINEIFNGPELADDFSLYLHAPTVTDPSLAPEGCSTYYVLSPVPHLGRANIDWEVEGPKYADRILDYLGEHYLPGLRDHLVTMRLLTPAGFRDDLNSHLGSAFSVEPVLQQSAWFRPHNRDDRLSNLYLVGAGTHPGAGIPGVVGSAKATAGLMLADAGLTRRTA
ncbi:phytoene desaturase [Natronocella acetinitrilica]|uniref:Phytoene desaturase (lycopene-forming) n=1 Tax=Natronocella acetinitrilica TaxID=414046 RepID=A0AAE3KBP2_9GAMM|nr:phytoene desaturase [Natronocella acetinitrilica]MCP1675875.1 phytoene desaturase [Natronocella acetinitrilica]